MYDARLCAVEFQNDNMIRNLITAIECGDLDTAVAILRTWPTHRLVDFVSEIAQETGRREESEARLRDCPTALDDSARR